MTGPPCQRPILRQSCPEGELCGRDEGGFFTKYLFQFARILAFCFLGEFCHAVLPLPIVIAIIPVTVLVLITSGHTTQALTRRKQSKKEAAANDTAAE